MQVWWKRQLSNVLLICFENKNDWIKPPKSLIESCFWHLSMCNNINPETWCLWTFQFHSLADCWLIWNQDFGYSINCNGIWILNQQCLPVWCSSGSCSECYFKHLYKFCIKSKNARQHSVYTQSLSQFILITGHERLLCFKLHELLVTNSNITEKALKLCNIPVEMIDTNPSLQLLRFCSRIIVWIKTYGIIISTGCSYWCTDTIQAVHTA